LGKLYKDNPGTANYLYEKLKELDEYRIALTMGHLRNTQYLKMQ